MIRTGLLRHGDVKGGRCFRGTTDDPLTDIGLDQMKQAVNGDYCWDHVVTSPLKRCAVFANEYAAQHNLSLSIEERFAEIHFGAWEGRSSAEIMITQGYALKRFWENPLEYTPPEAESVMDFASRVLEAWQDLIIKYAKQRVLLVTHGGVIRVLLCHIRQHPIGRLMEIDVEYGALFIVPTTPVSGPVKQS